MVTAIAILVILASVAAFMLHVSAAATATGTLELQGSRAYQAARIGIELGLYQIRQGSGSCPVGPQTITATGMLNGFSVSWECDDSHTFTEAGNSRKIVVLTSTATYGSSGNPDFVERKLMVSTER